MGHRPGSIGGFHVQVHTMMALSLNAAIRVVTACRHGLACRTQGVACEATLWAGLENHFDSRMTRPDRIGEVVGVVVTVGSCGSTKLP